MAIRTHIVLSAFLLAGTNLVANAQEVVPLKRTILSNGTGRYSIPIIIENRKLDAMLDTGSVGLRFLDLGGKPKGKMRLFGYDSGVVFHGPVINQNVVIGSSELVVPAQNVIKVSCDSEHPNCPGETLSNDLYRIGGMGLAKEGFEAIIGIAPTQANEDWVNPIAKAASSWILELPLPHEDTPGKLVIDPPAVQQSQYAAVQRSAEGKDLGQSFRASVEGCVVAEGAAPFCGPISFDTGAVGVTVSGRGAATLTGKSVQIHFHMADKSEIAISTRDVAQGAPAGRVFGVEAKRTMISAGVLPYFEFSVLYDSAQDKLAIKLR